MYSSNEPAHLPPPIRGMRSDEECLGCGHTIADCDCSVPKCKCGKPSSPASEDGLCKACALAFYRANPLELDAAYAAAVRRGNYLADLRERAMAVPVQVVATHELLMALLMAKQAMQHCAKCYTDEVDALVLQLECARRTAGRTNNGGEK